MAILQCFKISLIDHSRKESSSTAGDPDLVPQWSVQESVIDDLRISNIPRQPKYSYLIGKSAQKDTDFWRKSNASNIVNNNLYGSSSRPGAHDSGLGGPYLPQHNSASSKRLNDYHTTNNVQSAAYEDRINTALRKAPSGSSAASGSAGAGGSATSSAVQKSKSYSNFDFVRRDLNFQVCTPTCQPLRKPHLTGTKSASLILQVLHVNMQRLHPKCSWGATITYP